MATVVSICNLALSRLGDVASVSSIEPPDGSPQAEACRISYPMALGTILDMYNWSFATKRATLALRGDVDPAPWQYAYAVPADCRRAINLEETDATGEARSLTTDHPLEFEIATAQGGRVLLTNVKNPRLRYVEVDPPVGSFSSSFVDALSWLLASHLAGPKIRGGEAFNYAGYCMKYFQQTYEQAIARDARLTRVRPRHVAPWIRGR